MTANPPFFRGFDRADGFAAATALARFFYGDVAGALQALAGVESVSLVQFFPANATAPKSAILQGSRSVYVLLSGTETTTQGILDVVLSAQISVPGIPGFVGQFWGLLALNFWDHFSPLISPIIAGKNLVVLGHSLGGMIGDCMLPLVQSSLPDTPLICHTFGAGRPGDPTLAAAISSLVQRWENSADPIVAIPPIHWNGVGAQWPFSGPPPLPTWAAPGNAVTIDDLGNLTPGSNPVSTSAAAALLITGSVTPHFAVEYARRLSLQLSRADLAPPVSGFEDPEILLPQLGFLLGDQLMARTPVSPSLAGKFKVTVFYGYGISGISESFYTTALPAVIRSTVLVNYLAARMALAVDEFTFSYARISDPSNPRYVDFASVEEGIYTPQGLIATKKSVPKSNVRGAADTSAVLLRLKLLGGPSARIFLHGFDNSQDDQGTFTPNPAWIGQLAAFISMLKDGTNAIVYKYTQTPTLPFFSITSITPLPDRGATIGIEPPAPAGFPIGSIVAVTQIGSQMVGISGRKAVISPIDATGATITVGGAKPTGSYVVGSGKLYLASPLFAGVDYTAPERLTSHRVGRPFAEPVGRRKAVLPLRR